MADNDCPAANNMAGAYPVSDCVPYWLISSGAADRSVCTSQWPDLTRLPLFRQCSPIHYSTHNSFHFLYRTLMILWLKPAAWLLLHCHLLKPLERWLYIASHNHPANTWRSWTSGNALFWSSQNWHPNNGLLASGPLSGICQISMSSSDVIETSRGHQRPSPG